MDKLYGDLLPVAGDEVMQGGWSKPAAATMHKDSNQSEIKEEKKISIMMKPTKLAVSASTTNAAASAKPSNVSKPANPFAFKPRQATVLPPGSAVKQTGITALAEVVVETVKRSAAESQLQSNDSEEISLKMKKESLPQNNFDVSHASVAAFDVLDCYDPTKPNDYLAWCEERLERQRRAKLEEENRKKLEELERGREQLEKERADALAKGDYQKLQQTMGAGRGRGRGGITNLPAWMTQSNPSLARTADNLEEKSEPSPAAVENVGARIMSSMGYSEGNGLGKDGSGIVHAMEHHRSASGTGVVVMEDSDRRRVGENYGRSTRDREPEPTRRRPASINAPSCVVLLKNMVGAGDVDETLEMETKAECGKYGHVLNCDIFEVRDRSVAPEECVRIFVEFERQDSAIKAVRDLNGRFFAGRQVSASFFDEGRFRRKDLAPAMDG